MLGAEFWTPTRIFVLFIALQAAVNYDNGALPASLVTPSSESQRAMSTLPTPTRSLLCDPFLIPVPILTALWECALRRRRSQHDERDGGAI